MRWLRRMVMLGLFGSLALMLARRLRPAQDTRPDSPGAWPPLVPSNEPVRAAAEARPAPRPFVTEPSEPYGVAAEVHGTHTEAAAAPPAGATWVLPTDGGDCPDGFPIKGNDSSRIYHVPGGLSYSRTRAERCYARIEDAVADGYRPAKR